MRYTAKFILNEGKLLEEHYLEIENGVVKTLAPLSNHTSDEEMKSLGHVLITPGFVNTHNHSFQSLLKGFCDDKDFFTWRDDALYKYSKILTEEDIYNG